MVVSMTLQEKSLYRQNHPAKLFTDWITGIIALYPLWQHNLVTALWIAILPPIIVSLVIMRFADLEKQKQSSFGRYLRQYMTRLVEAARLAGYGIMAVGAWYHSVGIIVLGLIVIILAWLRGVILPGK